MLQHELEKIIKEKVDSTIVKNYLIAEENEYLGIYDDGQIAVGRSVGCETKTHLPSMIIKCPGIENINICDWNLLSYLTNKLVSKEKLTNWIKDCCTIVNNYHLLLNINKELTKHPLVTKDNVEKDIQTLKNYLLWPIRIVDQYAVKHQFKFIAKKSILEKIEGLKSFRNSHHYALLPIGSGFIQFMDWSLIKNSITSNGEVRLIVLCDEKPMGKRVIVKADDNTPIYSYITPYGVLVVLMHFLEDFDLRSSQILPMLFSE